MAEERIYTIIVKHQRVEVSSDIYHAYHKAREAERYQRKVIKDNEYSLEQFQKDGVNIEYQLSACGDFVDKLLCREQEQQLQQALQALTVEERLLIHELFWNEKSERTLAAETGIPRMTICDRKHRILKKLKNLMEI